MFYSDTASTRSDGIRGIHGIETACGLALVKALKPLIIMLSEGIRPTKLW